MNSRFDKVAMAMAGGLSRRNALRWFTGILPGAFLGATVAESGTATALAADPKTVKQLCQKYCLSLMPHQRKECEDACEQCNGSITALCGTAGSLICCPSGTVCCYSVNSCGQTQSTCTDTSSDPRNCGACGNVCSGGNCVNGKCVSSCRAPMVVCSGACTNTTSDVNNCGACGHACGAGQLCTNGVCACPAGSTICFSGGLNVCVNLASDPNNCGTGAYAVR